MRIRIVSLLLAMAGYAALAAAQVPHHPVVAAQQPFTPELLAQLHLTPEQTTTAGQVVRALNESLQIRLYAQGEFDDYTLNYPVYVSVGELLAIREQQLQAELAARKPDRVVVQNLAHDIAALQRTRQTVVAAAYNTIYAMLTPEQRHHLPQLATLMPQYG